MAATTPITSLLPGTVFASSDVLVFVDVSDHTQSPQGSTLKATLTSFFAGIPVPVVVTSASATALAAGLNGATNPAFAVDASTALQVAGLKVTGAVTGGTVAVQVTDSGAATNLSLNAKGTGTIAIGSASTGTVTVTPYTAFGAGIGVLGATPDVTVGVFVQGNLGGGTQANGLYSGATFQSAVTVSASTLTSVFRTAAAAFAITTGRGIFIASPSLGAGSSVTTFLGLEIQDQTAGGTNYAIKTGLGLVSLGDATNVVGNLTVATSKFVVTAASGTFTSAGTGQVATTFGVGAATPSASGAGITFPATQSASADANTLDDYEEDGGTPFTVGLTFGGGSTGMTFGTRYGYYTKVGRKVTIIIRLTLTAKGSSTGTARLTGLPFTSMATANPALAILGDNLTFTGQVGATVTASATTITVTSFATGAGNVDLTETAFANNTTLFISGDYFV